MFILDSMCSCSLPNFLAASYFTAAVQLLAQTLISEGPTAAQWFVLSFFFPVHLADHVDLYIFELPKFFDLPDFSDPWSSKNQPTLQMVKLSEVQKCKILIENFHMLLTLDTVTFWQKFDFLISNEHENSWPYGVPNQLNIWKKIAVLRKIE